MRPIFGEETPRILEPSPQGLISSALNGKIDSTLKVLTLNQTTTYFEILIENVNLADARSIDSAVWEYLRRLITVCP